MSVQVRELGKLTRRRLLRGAGGLAAVGVAGGALELLAGRGRGGQLASFAAGRSGSVREFRSRPDLEPPLVTSTAEQTAELFGREDAAGIPGDPDGFLFLAPGPIALQGTSQYGPLIVDREGEPVWFKPLATGTVATNFQAARYRGEPVLIWWEGRILDTGYGQGEVVIVDRSYRELARVRAANGRAVDLHALWLTPAGTVLFTCYPDTVAVDLRSIGGPRRGQVLQSVIQEVDVASGRLLLEWRSLEHVPPSGSHEPLGAPYDYLHVNSISPTPDGNLLISARHMWALYKLDRRTAAVIWTLGGAHGQFQLGPGAQFSWQHDARQLSPATLTVFDNGSNGPTQTERQSRALVLNLDEDGRVVTLRRAYTIQRPLVSTAMGSVQILSSGNVVVGWGTAHHTSEFAPDGRLLFDTSLPSDVYSYRGVWLPWRGAPRDRPLVASTRERASGAKLLHVSWNGATEVAGWVVAAGHSADDLRTLGVAARRGFETVIPIDPRFACAAVTACDSSRAPLARSSAVGI